LNSAGDHPQSRFRRALTFGFWALWMAITLAGISYRSWFWWACLMILGLLLYRDHCRQRLQALRELRWQACLCLRCGYNLTGNKSGTCPECGEPIVS
jgi:hypothetical protein